MEDLSSNNAVGDLSAFDLIQNKCECDPTDNSDCDDFDFENWANLIFNFNQACASNDSKQIVIILNEMISKIDTKDDLISNYIEPIEKSDFFDYSISCLEDNNELVTITLIKFIYYMVYSSSDFVQLICMNGVLAQIVNIFNDQMNSEYPYSPCIIKSFFKLFGYVCVDEPSWLFQMVQLGIIPLCEKILLTFHDDVDVIESVLMSLEVMFSYFNGEQNNKILSYPQVSSLFQNLKILLTSLIIERDHEIDVDQINNKKMIEQMQIERQTEIIQNELDQIESETFIQNSDIFEDVATGKIGYFFDPSLPIKRRLELIEKCFSVFSNYCNSDITVTILLNSTVPQFCYAILDPDFPMIFIEEFIRYEIILQATIVLRYTFRFSPHQPIQTFIDDINLNLLSFYIDANLPKITENILSVIGFIFHFASDTIFDAIDCGIFNKIFQLYYDADFGVKSTIFHVIAAGIINGDSSVVTSVFLKADILDILVDAIDTNFTDSKDEIPTALNVLAQNAYLNDDDIYSMIIPIINEIQCWY